MDGDQPDPGTPEENIEAPKKKRGRPQGSKNKKHEETNKQTMEKRSQAENSANPDRSILFFLQII